MIYDLTHTVNEMLPVYPGDPHVKIQQVGQLDRDGFADRLLTLGTHNGTHIDAPAHMLQHGKQLKDYAPGQFIARAICIDARHGFDMQSIVDAINSDSLAVLFCTGASSYFYEERYWTDYSVLDDQIVRLLAQKKVRIVGVDAGSFDNDDGFPVHKALLSADMLLLENLTNLEPLIGKSFELIALPLKLEADGAPARVIARTS